MSGFNLANYDQVDSRLDKFWTKHPDGRVHTEMAWHEDGKYIFRADLYADRDDTRPAATGWAEEHVTQTGVNKTSALENCETSAIGRALANMNFQTKARPSQTEMGKAERQGGNQQQGAPQLRNGQQQAAPDPKVKAALDALRAKCTKDGWDQSKVADRYLRQYGQELKVATDPTRIEAFTKLVETSPDDVKAAPSAEPAGAKS